jgi:hypothetical protein
MMPEGNRSKHYSLGRKLTGYPQNSSLQKSLMDPDFLAERKGGFFK